MYHNTHLGDGAKETTALDFIPGLNAAESGERMPEVQAVFDELAILQMTLNLEAEEKKKRANLH